MFKSVHLVGLVLLHTILQSNILKDIPSREGFRDLYAHKENNIKMVQAKIKLFMCLIDHHTVQTCVEAQFHEYKWSASC
jgi:hypothetical protein